MTKKQHTQVKSSVVNPVAVLIDSDGKRWEWWWTDTDDYPFGFLTKHKK